MHSGKSKDYSVGFYHELEPESYVSAKETLSIVFGLFDIKSVVDFGCGTGSWLRAAHDLGATRVTGLDGPWISKPLLVDPSIELITTELDKSAPVTATYDLAMSVEVAEHLPASRADSFVRDICAAAPRVLFGGAVPGQGGTSHINEQWQSYWADRFEQNGYLPVDVIRPQLARNQRVNTWYRNNTLLYVRRDEYIPLMNRLLTEGRLRVVSLDLVIPEVFERPGLRHSIQIGRQIPGKLFNAARRRIKIGRWRV